MRIGIVGLGRFGSYHLEKYKKIKEVNEIHVYDPLKRDVPYIYHSTLDSMAEAVDAVSIAAPSSLHYGIGEYFLSRGIHCLIEKPMATTVRDAEQLVNIALSTGAILQAGHIERFNDSYLKHKSFINDLLFITSSRYCKYTGRSKDIDVVLDLMIHDIDILLQHVDSEVRTMKVRGMGFRDRNSADVVYCSLEFVSGVCASLIAHRWSDLNLRKTIFCGKLHTIEVNFNDTKDSLMNEIQSFVNCVQGKETLQITGAEALKSLKLAIAIREKLYQGSCELCWLE